MVADPPHCRYWRYLVTHVWGDHPPVKVGDILIDRYNVPSERQVMNPETVKVVSGWTTKRLGEVTEPDVLTKIRAARAARHEKAVASRD